MKLTGEHRYRQAVKKASILRLRAIRAADAASAAGSHWSIEGVDDRRFIISELDRAYEAGLRDGAAAERERAVHFWGGNTP